MNATINLDLTTQQLADRVALAIVRFTGLSALRLSQSPTAPVPDDERAAYEELRAALHDMATTEYDRGYRTAMAGIRRREATILANNLVRETRLALGGGAIEGEKAAPVEVALTALVDAFCPPSSGEG